MKSRRIAILYARFARAKIVEIQTILECSLFLLALLSRSFLGLRFLGRFRGRLTGRLGSFRRWLLCTVRLAWLRLSRGRWLCRRCRDSRSCGLPFRLASRGGRNRQSLLLALPFPLAHSGSWSGCSRCRCGFRAPAAFAWRRRRWRRRGRCQRLQKLQRLRP